MLHDDVALLRIDKNPTDARRVTIQQLHARLANICAEEQLLVPLEIHERKDESLS